MSPSLGKEKQNRLSSGKLATSFLLLNSSHCLYRLILLLWHPSESIKTRVIVSKWVMFKEYRVWCQGQGVLSQNLSLLSRFFLLSLFFRICDINFRLRRPSPAPSSSLLREFAPAVADYWQLAPLRPPDISGRWGPLWVRMERLTSSHSRAPSRMSDFGQKLISIFLHFMWIEIFP